MRQANRSLGLSLYFQPDLAVQPWGSHLPRRHKEEQEQQQVPTCTFHGIAPTPYLFQMPQSEERDPVSTSDPPICVMDEVVFFF